MPANITLASTFAWPSPPRTGRTRSETKPKIRPVMPPMFISRPARRKKGTASRRKLSILLSASRAIIVAARGSKMSPKKNPAPRNAARPAEKPTGIPMTIRTISSTMSPM